MKNVRFLFLGAILTIAGTSAMLAGCGDDTGGTGGGTTGTGGAASTTGTGGDATTTTTTSTGTGMMAVLDCPSYCAAVDANCKGAMAQYPSTASCLAYCAALPPGKLGDTDGNSLGCRLYHGGAPAVADAATHCAHAGPTGGDKDVTDAAAATCGEGCDAFCSVAVKACTTAYADKETCLTDCKKFKPDMASYSTANTDKDTFGCRFYHLSVAATDAASATAHCGHIKSVSPTCTK